MMHSFCNIPEEREEQVFQVYNNGLLEFECLSYLEALKYYRHGRVAGYFMTLQVRYRDESEY